MHIYLVVALRFTGVACRLNNNFFDGFQCQKCWTALP